jgi:hypothetical protein
MKKRLTLLMIFLIPALGFGQITYEKGYFINNDNARTECLIKNMDWQYSPSEFQYKIEPNGEVQKVTIKNVREFQVYGYPRYVRDSVQIDMSPEKAGELTKESQPQWSAKMVFLKILIEGPATLYSFESTNFIRFFYSVNGSAIKQLVYKRYLAESYAAAENNMFRQQLWADVNLGEENKRIAEGLTYKENRLKDYFKKYNTLNGGGVAAGESYVGKTENKIPAHKRDVFNIKIAPGVVSSNMPTDHESSFRHFDFKQLPSLSLGLELEFILPFNKNKWSVLLEPVFTSFSSDDGIYQTSANVKHSAIEFPVGVRYYFFLNRNSRLFLNVHYVPSFSIKFRSEVTIDSYELEEPLVTKLTPAHSFAVGGGFAFKRLSLEFRYYSPRNMFSDYLNWNGFYTRESLILGYKFPVR